jgi:hypothetical protein
MREARGLSEAMTTRQLWGRDMINKAAAAGVFFFLVMLAGFVGLKIDQSTIAIMAGALIGIAIAIPTTVLILVVGLRPEPKPTPAPTQPSGDYTLHQNQTWPGSHTTPIWNRPPSPDDCRGPWVIEVDNPNQEWWQLREIAARAMNCSPLTAGELMANGSVRFLPAPKVGSK